MRLFHYHDAEQLTPDERNAIGQNVIDRLAMAGEQWKRIEFSFNTEYVPCKAAFITQLTANIDGVV